ncbi:PQQ-binding-like beta-propeller repeat protein [Herpetosiphon llansteffanensis]
MSQQWNSNMAPYRQDRSSCMPVILVLLILLAAIGGGVYFLLNKSLDSARAPIRTIEGTMVGIGEPVQVEQPTITGSVLYHSTQLAYDRNGDERNEVLVQVTSNSKYSMALLDGADGKALWQTELGSESYDLIALDQHIAVVKERDLRLFNAKDGTLAWQTRLSDRIQLHPPMLFISTDLIVVQTYDNILTAFELASGTQRWQKTLADNYARALAKFGDELCATERDAESGLEYIICYALQTGEQRQAIQLNEDWTEHIEWMADPQTNNGILRMRSDSDPATLSAIGLDQQQRWSVELADDFADSFRSSDRRLASSADMLAFGAGEQVAIITPEHQVVTYRLSDYALHPIGFDAEVLYIAAVKQRGTNTVSMLAVNAKTAELLWRLDDLGTSSDWSGNGSIQGVIVPGEGIVFGWLDQEIDDLVRVQLLKRADGTVGWSFQQEMFIGQLPTLTRSGNALLIQTGDGLTMANLRTGEGLWTLTR